MISFTDLYDVVEQYGITTDSRNCPPGSIFIALHGDKFNGNKFALQALEKGCSYAVVDEVFSDLSSANNSKVAQLSTLNSQLIEVLLHKHPEG